MNFIRELLNAGLAGLHAGKGHKLTRKGKYDEALSRYELALVYEKKILSGPNAATLECLARTYVRLGRLKEALVAAEESFYLYKQLNSKNNLISEATLRVERFIAGLKSGNVDDINKMLTR